MRLDKEVVKLATLSLSIVMLAIVLFGYIYNIRTELKVASLYNAKLEILKQSNTNLDRFVSRKISFINYDDINQEMKAFDETIMFMEEKLEKIIQSDRLHDTFLTMKKQFKRKQEEVEFYKTQMGATVNSLRYIPLLHSELLARGFSHHDDVYTHVMQLGFGEHVDKKSFYKALENLSQYSSKEDETLSLFVAHAIFVYEKISHIQESVRSIQALDMEEKLISFELKSQIYLNEEIYNVMDITLMAVGLLLILSLFSGWLFRQKVSHSKQLSYFKKGVDKSDNSVIITDTKRRVIYVNDSFERVSGYHKDEVIGEDARMLHSGLMKESCDAIVQTVSSGKSWLGEFTNIHKDGSKYIEKASIIPIEDSHGKLQYIMEVKLDITKEKEHKVNMLSKNKEILKRFYHDNLTTLANRHRLLKDIARAKTYTMVLFNINAFKEINDFYGVTCGDRILTHFANALKRISKEENSTAYRLHADEFCLLTESSLNKESIESIIMKMEKEIESFVQESHIYYTFGVGVSYSKMEKPYNESILVEADLALKYAKKSSNVFELYHDKYKLSNDYENNMAWIQKLKIAMAEDRIVPYFQPVVNTQDGSILYYESLIRMLDSDGKAISPFFFLEVSKKAKLYIALTKIMIEKSFHAFKEHQDGFSINFSYEDMVEPSIMILLEEKIKSMKNPERFTAEILESESIENYEVVKVFIDTLKSYGCKVAIDDFGSGYSNFERLFKLNIDYLKIDGSIVKELDTNAQMRIIAETIVDFARKSEMKVVAEFVHSQEIVDILEKMEVYNHQGFHFSEPIPSPDFTLVQMPVA